MGALIARYQGECLQARGDGFFTLARAIVGQQISVKAADAVWARLAACLGKITPQAVVACDDAALRGCGLSASKVQYLRNVAAFFMEQSPHPSSWDGHDDAQAIRALTHIKGIGIWTAEMFLIFHLLRPDVFPVKDLGVLKAIDLHYPSDTTRTPSDYIAFAERWRPYRTVATWYLWRALDPVPVAY